MMKLTRCKSPLGCLVLPVVMMLLSMAGSGRAETAAPKAAAADTIVVTDRRLHSAEISPLIYGNFMELLSDLVPSLWAEKLDVTSFEYLRTPEELRLRRPRFAFDPKFDPQDRLWRPWATRPTPSGFWTRSGPTTAASRSGYGWRPAAAKRASARTESSSRRESNTASRATSANRAWRGR